MIWSASTSLGHLWTPLGELTGRAGVGRVSSALGLGQKVRRKERRGERSRKVDPLRDRRFCRWKRRRSGFG